MFLFYLNINIYKKLRQRPEFKRKMHRVHGKVSDPPVTDICKWMGSSEEF